VARVARRVPPVCRVAALVRSRLDHEARLLYHPLRIDALVVHVWRAHARRAPAVRWIIAVRLFALFLTRCPTLRARAPCVVRARVAWVPSSSASSVSSLCVSARCLPAHPEVIGTAHVSAPLRDKTVCTDMAHTTFRAATDLLPSSALVDSAVSTATTATEPRAQTDASRSSSKSESSHSTCTEISASDDSTDEDAVDGAALPAVTMFSEDTRQHVLGLLEEEYPVSDVAEIIGCSARSVRRWSRHFRENGTVWCDPSLNNLHGDAAIRNTHLPRAILTLVESEPVAFLRDHVDLLVALILDHPASDHRYVSAATVYRVLRYHDYTRKRIERLYLESSVQGQRAFAMLIDEIPLRCLVSCDETHTAGSDLLRRYGRSRPNIPCALRDRDTRPLKRTSTMMAVTLTHGVLWSQTVVVGSAQTSDDWRLFLLCLHARMNMYIPGLAWEMQPDACVVLYDNASIHDHWGDEYMQANGIPYVRLPPYSPKLQPIKGVLAELKKHVQALVYEDSRYMDKPLHLMAAAVGMDTTAQVAGQFSRVSHEIARLLAGAGLA